MICRTFLNGIDHIFFGFLAGFLFCLVLKLFIKLSSVMFYFIFNRF